MLPGLYCPLLTGGKAPLAFRAGSTVSGSGSATTVVPAPAGLAVGDLWLILIQVNSVSITTTTPAGFTLLFNDVSSPNTGFRGYSTVVTSVPASVTFTHSTGVPTYSALSVAYFGGSGLVDVVGAIGTGSSTTIVVPAITATQNGATILFNSSNNGALTSTNSGGFTSRVFISAASTITLYAWDLLPSSAGSKAANTVTWSGSGSNSKGVQLQIY